MNGLMIFSCFWFMMAVYMSFGVLYKISKKEDVGLVGEIVTLLLWGIWWFSVMAFFNRLLG